ncbi:BirA family biotin operon repressor/biotin-[acetyl-CoA-carboxylase] ligase [Sphingobium xenophagum]|uniref:BirA family biotin operon repressor/biotin-[acetyl-CoA-carboxylase] ligase n=1 Tax=Sphingobium xenophagum TaxID=121428 RepID=A0ABU1WVQ7_SPHXE|nr:endonuclease domain-containing protein [Sphingobium xenophagum]MDR7153379.1 BirA family biotin operon repressor/biotin-[acetyl-CoA-carboxylase] ligase [Sphingobium xenophagum]
MDETPLVPPPASGRGLGGGPAQPFKRRETNRAKSLRNAAPTPERLLWQQLRNRKLGYKFSRQMPVGPYFADFLCREVKLIIELDGESHNHTVEYDTRRDDYCHSQGYQILRFSNADVMGNLEGVVTHIQTTLAQAHPRPLPQAGGEQK